MKNLFCILLAVTLLIFPITASANEETPNETIEYLEDGSYMITTFEDEAISSEIVLFSNTVTKSKTTKYYDSSNTLKWYVKVTGTFTYGNGSSKCTSSSVSAQSYADTWKITSKSSSKSGNTASATATAKQYLGNTVLKTITKTVKLTCSATGDFS